MSLFHLGVCLEFALLDMKGAACAELPTLAARAALSVCSAGHPGQHVTIIA